jgi:SAM-dependent methyltransferase
MTERESKGQQARSFFENLWRRGDPWELETAELDQARYARQIAMLGERYYPHVLEIGCGAGAFTRLLARRSGRVVALDIAPAAIARAVAQPTPEHVEFRAANVMEYDPRREGPWDLVVLAETIYFLGWLYSFFEVAWLAAELFGATREEGRLLLANTFGGIEEPLLHPWIIRTYRDLFLNVGYRLEAEEVLRGVKNGVSFEILISLFVKGTPGDDARATRGRPGLERVGELDEEPPVET